MSEWNYVSSKLGSVRPETRAVAREVFEAAKRAGHDVWFIWGMGDPPEHSTGLALDFMVRNAAGGQWVRDYVWAHRARLRLRHVIWAQHITSTVTQPGVVRRMEDRGNPTANHYDHDHVWLFAGPYQPPPGGDMSITGQQNDWLHNADHYGWGLHELHEDIAIRADGQPGTVRSSLVVALNKLFDDVEEIRATVAALEVGTVSEAMHERVMERVMRRIYGEADGAVPPADTTA